MGTFKQIFTAPDGNDDDSTVIFVKKHYRYIILVFILIILYISNGLIYDLEIKRQNQLEEDLLRARTRYNIQLIEFFDFFNYRNMIDLSDKYELGLEEPEKPPVKVKK
jgi:hypothetical protein